jgi:hypothetical protein
MYVYDDFDRTLVDERVREFRDQVARRLSGELTEEEFKPLRLMNGVYLQLHAYMFRVAIPARSSAQLRTLAHVARRYDRTTAISPRARTSSSTGSSWKSCSTRWPIGGRRTARHADQRQLCAQYHYRPTRAPRRAIEDPRLWRNCCAST